MKILHLIASVDPEGGGPIEGVVKSAQVWKAMGHSRDIASLDAPDDPWVAACPVPVFPLGIRARWYKALARRIPWLRYGYTPHLTTWLKQHAGDYDAIVVNGLWNYVALGSSRVLPGGATPYCVFTHGMLDPWFAKTYPLKNFVKQLFWLFSEGRLLNGAGAVLFTTEEERVLARDAFWPYRVRERTVGYGTADDTGDPTTQIAAFRAKTGLGQRPFLLYLSRIHPKKGCDLLIRAFAEIAAEQPDLDLVMAGPDKTGWIPELRDLAASLGIADRVHWPGMLSGEAKWGAYRSCEAFVLPSHQENFGIVVAEALSCSQPVLISDKVNIWREIADGQAGLVARDDQAGTTDLLRRFLAMSPDEKAAMGRNARACFLAHFEIGEAAGNLLRIIDEVRVEAGLPGRAQSQPRGDLSASPG